MKKIKLSVVLATRNEEVNIGRCLESVRQLAGEIVVADEHSSDKTVEIVKKYGARVISVPHQDNFHITKNIAIDAAKGEWILQLDADEVISPELAAEIGKVIASNPSESGFWVNRRNWFLNRYLTKGGQYPDPTLRLYRRGSGRLPARDVHEQAQVTAPVGRLKSDLLHFRDTSFAKYLQGFARYSSFRASQMTTVSFSDTINYLIIKPMTTFLSIYIRHRGYVDGWAGFIFALFSGLIYPAAFLKYWQLKHHPS